jgi:hypothetical protein
MNTFPANLVETEKNYEICLEEFVACRTFVFLPSYAAEHSCLYFFALIGSVIQQLKSNAFF